MALKDTLQTLKQDEARTRQAELDRPKVIAEWQATVRKLFDTLRSYLSEYEKGKLLSFSHHDVSTSEELLGSYTIPTMEIRAGNATISVTPVGRLILGALGRVDMHVRGKALEREKIILLHTLEQEKALPFWVISAAPEKAMRFTQSHIAPGQRKYVLMTKETVEKAVDYLLQ